MDESQATTIAPSESAPEQFMHSQSEERELWELRAAAASAPAAVRVRNLKTTVQGPEDAWGRLEKLQPALISATVTFHDAFGSCAETDRLGPDTIHYGELSKAILDALKRPLERGDDTVTESMTFGNLVSILWCHLAGRSFEGHPLDNPIHYPILNLEAVRTFELSVHLPKASLLGDGITGTHIAEFNRRGETVAYCTALRIHDVKVPTLIGLNNHERRAKQMVIANLELSQLGPLGYEWLECSRDITTALVETMSASSFETLEALARAIATNLSQNLSNQVTGSGPRVSEPRPDFTLRISLEKPMAVVFADAPCVELKVRTGDILDAIRSGAMTL